jgi:hypothetical protein
MFVHATMKLLTSSQHPFRDSLQRPCSGNFDPENAYSDPKIYFESRLWYAHFKKLTNSKEAKPEFDQLLERKS